MTKPSVSFAMKRLRENGFVRVEPYRLDERKKLLFATDKGMRVRALMDECMAQLPNQLYRDFTEDELVVLNQLQKKMLRNLSMNTDCDMEG